MEEEKASLQIDFKPGWNNDKDYSEEKLLGELRSKVDDDKRRQQTTIGPQQDDINIKISGQSAKKFASQGQQRSVSLSVLLAVVDEVYNNYKEKPLILLDDVSSELDDAHRKQLFRHVVELGGQVMITTTDDSLVSGLTEKISRRFFVDEGKIKEKKANHS